MKRFFNLILLKERTVYSPITTILITGLQTTRLLHVAGLLYLVRDPGGKRQSPCVILVILHTAK